MAEKGGARFAWDPVYVERQLINTVQSMMGAGDVRKRIYGACTPYFLVIDPDEFPVELRGDFAALREVLRRFPPLSKDSCSMEASADLMTDREVEEFHEKLVLLLVRVSRLVGESGGC